MADARKHEALDDKRALTANDRRVLESVEWAMGHWDGYVPHTLADWTGLRRLGKRGLVRFVDFGACECDRGEPHEDASIYALTDAGKALLEAGHG
jgi:hypothetical protein